MRNGSNVPAIGAALASFETTLTEVQKTARQMHELAEDAILGRFPTGPRTVEHFFADLRALGSVHLAEFLKAGGRPEHWPRFVADGLNWFVFDATPDVRARLYRLMTERMR